MKVTMKNKVLIALAFCCIFMASCRQKPKEELLEIEGVEQFELHPEWTEDNPEAFWE